MNAIINGKIILPDEKGNFFIAYKTLTYDEKIISVDSPHNLLHAENIIDAKNNFVAPGFINIHIHGCNGYDTMDEDADALDGMMKFLPACGVTSFLPTTMTMSVARIKTALKNIRGKMNQTSDGAKIWGAHLEGPFINVKFKGAQNEQFILKADFEWFAEFADVIKIVTVAPELTDEQFIQRCREENIVVSIGHSAATYEETLTAIERGANHVTHLFNAQTGLHHRKPGIVGAALTENVIVELIADDVHVHPIAQEIVAKCKPREKIILITDSLRACGIGEGVSELGGQKVFVKGNLATLADGTLVGSVATMNNVMKNFYRNSKFNVAEVVELVTKNPAQELNLYDEIGSIEAGKAADFVIFDADFNVKRTIISGRIAF